MYKHANTKLAYIIIIPSRFDSSNLRNMIFADQFLQISTKLPSKYIYGLGEHRNNLLLNINWQQFTMFNRDGAPSENVNNSQK